MTMTRREFLEAGAVAGGTIVLPYVVRPLTRDLPALPTIGVQVEHCGLTPVQQIPYLMPGSLVRYRISWESVELTPGMYAWEAHDRFMTACPCPVMVNIITTPLAYRLYPAAKCSPPRREYKLRLVEFVRQVIERYHPAAVEFWNEPEIPAQDAIGIHADHVLGGFGDNAEYYGELLRDIYAMMTDGWYSTWLVAGSMMDSSSLWWERARLNAFGNYDAISYHSYVTHNSTDYDHTGNMAAMLRLMGEECPLILSETALLAETDSPEFRQAQAVYLRYQVDQREAHGLTSVIWYTLGTNLWRNSDLILWDKPQPAYWAYREVMG